MRALHRFMWFVALVVYVTPGIAVNSDAIALRLEVGTHLAAVRAMATDRAGQLLVTASEDKSARVWEAYSGRLLQVFRPPSAQGNEGKLFAVSMLADGSLFATGGWSANNDVYLVQRGNGDVRHRITGLPNVVTSLAFSPDGKMLAVGLWGEHGLRLFTSLDGWKTSQERTGDSDVGGDIQALAWSPSGDRLASTSTDGAIRLYEPRLNRLELTVRRPPSSRSLPFGIAFSPSGHALAVGSTNLPEILILDSENLAEQSKIVARESTASGGWSSIAWADGETVVAGGSRHSTEGEFTICVAKRSSNRCEREQNVARNTLTSLVRLEEGRVAYAAADPAWGVIAGDGTLIRSVVAEVTDFRQMRKSFRVAPDGSGVVVPTMGEKGENNQKNEMSKGFDLHKLGWRSPARDWSAPATRVAKLIVDDWFEQVRPRIGTRTLALEPNELALTAAVSAGADRVIVGTNFLLRAYDQTGRELWRTPAPGTTWQVNISADGRWLVAGFSDGTLRWYRMRDGIEQIAVFPHPDGKRWIAWTPKGFYATSPGSEDLLGWQQERGHDKGADFFPVSRLRSQFYRPEVIEKTLELMDETAAMAATSVDSGRVVPVKPVAQLLPPVVQIVSPAAEAVVTLPRVTLRYMARSPLDAPVSALRVRVNGQLVMPTDVQNLSGTASDITEIKIPIPPQDSEIQLFAENRNGVSAPAIVRVNWQGAKATAPTVPVEMLDAPFKPRLYVLAVGVSIYANAAYNLGLAAKDATDFATVFRGQKGKLYGDVTVRLLTDNQATKDDVLDGLEWLKREVTSRDVGIMFLAGHGLNDNTGKYFFMPHNADPSRLLRTGVAQNDIKDTLNSLAGKAVFFVDTCHSGNALGTARTRSMTSQVDAFINELASAENGVVVFTAATGKQLSQENDAWGNGAFTKAVVEGISGKADFGNTGRVTHKGLDFYVSERVKQLTKGTQSPVSIAPMGITDFPIAVVQPGSH